MCLTAARYSYVCAKYPQTDITTMLLLQSIISTSKQCQVAELIKTVSTRKFTQPKGIKNEETARPHNLFSASCDLNLRKDRLYHQNCSLLRSFFPYLTVLSLPLPWRNLKIFLKLTYLTFHSDILLACRTVCKPHSLHLWPLTPTAIVSCPCPWTTGTNLHRNRFIHFQIIMFRS